MCVLRIRARWSVYATSFRRVATGRFLYFVDMRFIGTIVSSFVAGSYRQCWMMYDGEVWLWHLSSITHRKRMLSPIDLSWTDLQKGSELDWASTNDSVLQRQRRQISLLCLFFQAVCLIDIADHSLYQIRTSSSIWGLFVDFSFLTNLDNVQSPPTSQMHPSQRV